MAEILTSENLLIKVKKALGVSGTYHDDTLNVYIDEVKSLMLMAGVSENVINSSVAVGIISRGVADLWNYGASKAELSPYFHQRLTQLVLNEATSETLESEEGN